MQILWENYMTREFHVKFYANIPGDVARGIHESGCEFSSNRKALFLALILQHILRTDHTIWGRVGPRNKCVTFKINVFLFKHVLFFI